MTRTEGTTASFTKELVRRAVLIVAEREAPRTEPADVREALDELLCDRDRLTRRLLGVRDGSEDEEWFSQDGEDDDAEMHGGPPSGERLLGPRPGPSPRPPRR